MSLSLANLKHFVHVIKGRVLVVVELRLDWVAGGEERQGQSLDMIGIPAVQRK